MSEPSDEQAAMQHYLVCGSEDCQENGQFYCNDCHRPLCEQCKEEHKKSSNTKNYEIVLYRHRKYQLPVEISKIIQHEIQTSFVEIAKLLYVPNA